MMGSILRNAVIWLVVVIKVSHSFDIPLPFGSISINKNENNETNVDINRNIDILGYGTNSGLSIGSKNGAITTQAKGGVLLNGTNYGANSTFGVDNSKGLRLDTDLNLDKNQTIQGGLGKEVNFLQGLIDYLSKNKTQN